jgi:hypothetical protein
MWVGGRNCSWYVDRKIKPARTPGFARLICRCNVSSSFYGREACIAGDLIVSLDRTCPFRSCGPLDPILSPSTPNFGLPATPGRVATGRPQLVSSPAHHRRLNSLPRLIVRHPHARRHTPPAPAEMNYDRQRQRRQQVIPGPRASRERYDADAPSRACARVGPALIVMHLPRFLSE